MWNEVKTDDDILSLKEHNMGFHDSVIVSVNYTSGIFTDNNNIIFSLSENHRLSMIIDSGWTGKIEMLFSGVRKFSFSAYNDNYDKLIFGGYIKFHTDLFGKTRDDRLVVWADDADFNPIKYNDELDLKKSGISYIIAESLKWRCVDD